MKVLRSNEKEGSVELERRSLEVAQSRELAEPDAIKQTKKEERLCISDLRGKLHNVKRCSSMSPNEREEQSTWENQYLQLLLQWKSKLLSSDRLYDIFLTSIQKS